MKIDYATTVHVLAYSIDHLISASPMSLNIISHMALNHMFATTNGSHNDSFIGIFKFDDNDELVYFKSF